MNIRATAFLSASRWLTLAVVIGCGTILPALLPGSASATHPEVYHPFDHYACFKMRDDSRFRAHVNLDALREDLQIGPSCKVLGRGRLYCSPVRKRLGHLRYREGTRMSPLTMPGRDQYEDRICYRVRCEMEPIFGPFEVEDQFGRRKVGEFEVKLLCTNARAVRHGTTSTSSTSFPDTTTTTLGTDPCAVVDCAEGHFCRPKCDKPREAECVPFGEPGDTCGGFVPYCRLEQCGPGLFCDSPDDIPDLPGVCRPKDPNGCDSDADCGGDGFCRPSCENPDKRECHPFSGEGETCGGFTPFCESERCGDGLVCKHPFPILHGPGVCVPEGSTDCLNDDDCDPGSVCVDAGVDVFPGGSVCVPGCRTNRDCDDGQQCLPTPCPGPPCADQCVDVGPCRTDSDCPDGEVCEPGAPTSPLENLCVPGCHDDADCPSGESCADVVCVRLPCPGQCVPDPDGECRVDADCSQGEVCEPARPGSGDATVCVPGCHEDRQCDDNQFCRRVVCVTTPCPGVCEDKPDDECRNDVDCPSGEVCEPGRPGADGQAGPKVCAPGCHTDEQCRPGQECVEVACFTTPCPGQCVGDSNDECRTDDDCPRGEVCEPGRPDASVENVPNVCVPGCHDNADCDDNERCKIVQCITTPCPGICEPTNQGECRTDKDCPRGEVCEQGGPTGSGTVGPTVCVPGCHDDADCSADEVCNEVICITTPCPGQCAPHPPGQCRTDADCPPGEGCLKLDEETGICVLDGACGTCTSDDQCRAGTRCNAAEVCLPSCECPACDVCAGECVPDDGECGECVSDNECGAGMRCNSGELCLISCDCPDCAVCGGHCEPVGPAPAQ